MAAAGVEYPTPTPASNLLFDGPRLSRMARAILIPQQSAIDIQQSSILRVRAALMIAD
jgi:hypothetical protein